MSLSLVAIEREASTQTPHYGERAIADAELVCFENPRPGRPYEVSIELPEFTCKCPFSGYPDFAVLRLTYQPGPRVVELKAIKLYVNSYRDRSISHEEVSNRILDDLVEACAPSGCSLRLTSTSWKRAHRGSCQSRNPPALLAEWESIDVRINGFQLGDEQR